MKKALIAMVLVAALSMSAFAMSLELVNVIGGNAPLAAAVIPAMAPGSGVGLGFELGAGEVIIGYSSLDFSGTTGSILTLKGYYPVWGPLNVGLQIDMVSADLTASGSAANVMALTVGVKKALVSGVDMRLDGIVYFTDGEAMSTPATTSLLSGGVTVGLSIPL